MKELPVNKLYSIKLCSLSYPQPILSHKNPSMEFRKNPYKCSLAAYTLSNMVFRLQSLVDKYQVHNIGEQ